MKNKSLLFTHLHTPLYVQQLKRICPILGWEYEANGYVKAETFYWAKREHLLGNIQFEEDSETTQRFPRKTIAVKHKIKDIKTAVENKLANLNLKAEDAEWYAAGSHNERVEIVSKERPKETLATISMTKIKSIEVTGSAVFYLWERIPYKPEQVKGDWAKTNSYTQAEIDKDIECFGDFFGRYIGEKFSEGINFLTK
jgi:hypothetical protein